MKYKCRSCHSEDIEIIIDFGSQPLANGLVKKDEFEIEKRYPLALCFCRECGLVQLNYIVDPKELFSNYYWVTGTSEGAKSFSKVFMEEAIKRNPISENGYVLEIASNDGTFLRPFKEMGYSILGVDPAQNIVLKANEEGIETLNEFFGAEIAKRIVRDRGYPSLFFARNVFAHVAELDDFVEGLRICSDDDNIGIIEVEYGDKIVNEVHYDSVYHEHLYYYTLQSITKVLERHDLFAYDVMHSPISGGAIVVFFSKKKREQTEMYEKMMSSEAESGLNDIKSWRRFAEKAQNHKKLINNMIDGIDGELIGYGASARSSTMFNFCGIDNSKIKCIIDQNPLKQGMYTPGTHIPIVSADEAFKSNPKNIFISAWNFKDEVIRFLKSQYGFKGDVILPLPYPGEMRSVLE